MLVRLMLVQALLLSGLAAASGRGWAVAVTAVLGVATVLGWARRHGRWWTSHIGIVRRYRRRRRTVAPPAEADRRLRTLHQLVPDLAVFDVAGSGGIRTGVARDSSGWYAVLAVLPSGPLGGPAGSAVPLTQLTRLLAETGQDGLAVQVVLRTGAPPSCDVGGACRESYRQLRDTFPTVPPDRDCHLALRLAVTPLAQAVAVGGVDESAHAPEVVAALVRQCGKVLDRAGLGHRVLDADELTGVLGEYWDLVAGPARPLSIPDEMWHCWRSFDVCHTCYWLAGWPELGAHTRPLDRLCTIPGTTVSLVLRPGEDTELRCLVRLTAAPARLEQSRAALLALADELGLRLRRLDGEHAPATYATAPTGGGQW